MKTLVATQGLSGNPFEHYTAESEPNIAEYAVRPPYLQAISDRVNGLSSFILFGDRGAGKSATRITVYNEVWKQVAEPSRKEKSPFVVNLTDYSSLQTLFGGDKLTESHIVSLIAFIVVEQILVWLSSLEEGDRQIYIQGLDASERTLTLALLKGFYLSVSEMDREVSTADALRLLNSAWPTKSAVWASQRWDALSKIIASIVGVLGKKEIDSSLDISGPAEALLKSLTGSNPNAPKAILGKLVELGRSFGFSGISVLVDKVDETPLTANSAEATARLVGPLLAHVQLLEVSGFSWVMFLWSNVQGHFNGKYPVRLDKIAHANITWDQPSLREMIDARVRFFSGNRISFAELLEDKSTSESIFHDLVSTAVSSPRELIKLMDIIFREHDARGDSAPNLLDRTSLDIGQDKYALETIGTWFNDKFLQQVLRLGKDAFVNRDVQSAFKISDQGARVKIRNWEDAGLVRQSGTAPSEVGGKPAYLFVVTDARVKRIIAKKLSDIVGAEVEGDSTDSEDA